MPRNPHNAYLESRILSADPKELIRLLYQAAILQVREARRHLLARDIRARAKSISKALAILTELAIALDYQRGGQIALNLGRLYDYMMSRLTEANLKQTDEPLAETLGLLTTLKEGWDGVVEQLNAAAQPAERWRSAAPDSPEPSQAWKL